MLKLVAYLLTAAAVIIFLVAFGAFVHGSTLAYARHEDIGLTTGRIRHTQTILTIPVRTVVHPSGITAELEISDDVTESQWKRVNTFAFKSNVSPRYIYHSALSQLNSLELAWRVFPYTKEAKKLSAQAFLNELATTGNDHTSGDLTAALMRFDDTQNVTAEHVQKAINEIAAAKPSIPRP